METNKRPAIIDLNEDKKITESREAYERKTELILLAAMEECKTREERRRFAEKIGIEWKEYQRIKTKYRYVLEKYKRYEELKAKEKSDACRSE